MKIKILIILQFVIILLLSIKVSNLRKNGSQIITTVTKEKEDDKDKSIRFIQPTRNLPFIEAFINGKKAYFLLDSGAGSTVVDENQSGKYGFKSTETDYEFKGIGGVRDMNETDITSIKINNKNYITSVKSSDLGLVITTIKEGTGITILGIIGSDFFERYGFTFNYHSNILKESL